MLKLEKNQTRRCMSLCRPVAPCVSFLLVCTGLLSCKSREFNETKSSPNGVNLKVSDPATGHHSADTLFIYEVPSASKNNKRQFCFYHHNPERRRANGTATARINKYAIDLNELKGKHFSYNALLNASIGPMKLAVWYQKNIQEFKADDYKGRLEVAENERLLKEGIQRTEYLKEIGKVLKTMSQSEADQGIDFELRNRESLDFVLGYVENNDEKYKNKDVPAEVAKCPLPQDADPRFPIMESLGDLFTTAMVEQQICQLMSEAKNPEVTARLSELQKNLKGAEVRLEQATAGSGSESKPESESPTASEAESGTGSQSVQRGAEVASGNATCHTKEASLERFRKKARRVLKNQKKSK